MAAASGLGSKDDDDDDRGQIALMNWIRSRPHWNRPKLLYVT